MESTEISKITIGYRWQLFEEIPRLLGITTHLFIQIIAPYLIEGDLENGTSPSDRLYKAYKRAKAGKPFSNLPHYRYHKFDEAVNLGVVAFINEKFENKTHMKKKQDIVKKKWEINKETINGYIYMAFINDSFFPTLESLIENMKTADGNHSPLIISSKDRNIEPHDYEVPTFSELCNDLFDCLDQRRGELLYEHFDLLSGISEQDLQFIASIVRLPNDKKANLEYAIQRKVLRSDIFLKQLFTNAEVINDIKNWIVLRNSFNFPFISSNSDLEIDKVTIWTKNDIQAKLDKLDYFKKILFVRYVRCAFPDKNGNVLLGVRELDIFYTFKYCLTPEAQKQIIDAHLIKAEKSPPAGDP